jgi:hypothetical protein
MTRKRDGAFGDESARCVSVNVTPPTEIVADRLVPVVFAATS